MLYSTLAKGRSDMGKLGAIIDSGNCWHDVARGGAGYGR
jgi:hypothetical protein